MNKLFTGLFWVVLMVLSNSLFSQNAIKEASQKLNEYQLKGQYQQAPLPYAFNALEPYLDAETMEIHYSKHHAGYTNNLNKSVSTSELAEIPLFDFFAEIEKYPVAIRNNGGGFYNHLIFWQMLKPNGGGEPTGALAAAIKAAFGDYTAFQSEFSNAASGRFGSGWAWLSVDSAGKLFVSSTANQDNPLMSTELQQGIPVLAIDVWEHAYYLKYQNKRGDYISSFWRVVNWDEVANRYAQALKALNL